MTSNVNDYLSLNVRRIPLVKSILKLYCRYLYTRPCMINHIWGLKQLLLQVKGHAWFHLQWLRWPVRNGEGAKNSKMKIYVSSGIRTRTHASPRQESCSALDHLATRAWWWSVVKCLSRIMGYKCFKKMLRDNTCQLDYGYMCFWTECHT